MLRVPAKNRNYFLGKLILAGYFRACQMEYSGQFFIKKEFYCRRKIVGKCRRKPLIGKHRIKTIPAIKSQNSFYDIVFGAEFSPIGIGYSDYQILWQGFLDEFFGFDLGNSVPRDFFEIRPLRIVFAIRTGSAVKNKIGGSEN